MEYERCVTGMKGNLKHVLEIGWSSADPKTILQARDIANDCYMHIMDLTTNGVVVTDAIKYVQGKMDHLNTVEKKLLQDIKNKEDAVSEDNRRSENSERDLEEQQQTHNGIF
jgi:hypothetical protein